VQREIVGLLVHRHPNEPAGVGLKGWDRPRGEWDRGDDVTGMRLDQCGQNDRRSSTERHSLGEDSVTQVGRETALGLDVDLHAERIFQLVGERDQVEEIPLLHHFDQEIEIDCLTASGRAAEPNTRTFRTPWTAATRRISARRLLADSNCTTRPSG
jgi:hypothetical protein